MDYKKVLELINSARNIENGKPICTHTRLFKRCDAIAMQYHETDIITWHSNGLITLNSGGWRTVTTKQRINEFADGVRLSQRNSVWSVSRNGGETMGFADGMTFHMDGMCEGFAPIGEAERIQKLKKRITKYSNAFIDKLYDGEIQSPSGGDCWSCLMKSGTDATHLISHIDENYFVPSLLVNALNEFRASQVDKQTMRAFMEGETQYAYWKNRDSYGAKHLAKYLKRYLLRKLGEVS